MLIEPRCHLLDKREQGSGGGAPGPEAMLSVSKVQVGSDVLEN